MVDTQSQLDAIAARLNTLALAQEFQAAGMADQLATMEARLNERIVQLEREVLVLRHLLSGATAKLIALDKELAHVRKAAITGGLAGEVMGAGGRP